jgi:hypothetical protein
VTRCPSMSLAPSALVQLDSACELFSKAARGFRATKVLVSGPDVSVHRAGNSQSWQSIMMNLREKAHYSLEEYRLGNGSPLSRMNPSDPSSPVDDDELSILGGKTRLVSDGEPSSPRLMDRSPTTQNPVVPLPIPSNMQAQLDLNTQMYIRSFNQQGQQQQQQQQLPLSAAPLSQTSSASSFMDVMQSPQDYSDMSPVSMFGMSTMPQATSYNPSNTNVYQPQQVQQQQQQVYQTSPGPSNQGFVSDFPQYFPVYDYGAGLNNSGLTMNGGSQNVGGYGVPNSPQLETPSHPGAQRRSSGSPEAATLQATWQDFVATMGI